MTRKWWWVVALLGSVALALGFAGKDGVAAPGKPKIAWSPCFKQFGPFQCGTVQVPLDYDSPNGAAISIAMVRLPATDPSAPNRIAVPQPGRPRRLRTSTSRCSPARSSTPTRCGPASTSSGSTRAASRAARALRCFGNPKQWEPFFTPFAFPLTPEEEAIWVDARPLPDRRLRAARRHDRRPHVDRQRRARPRSLARRPSATPSSPTPATRTGRSSASPTRTSSRARCAQWSSTACSTRSRGRPAQPRAVALAVLDAPAQRRRGDGDAERVLPALRRRRTCAVRPRLGRRGTPISPRREPVADPGRRVHRLLEPDRDRRSARCTTRRAGRSFAQLLADIESASIAAGERWPRASALAYRPAVHHEARVPAVPELRRGVPGVACATATTPTTYAAWSAAGAAADAAFGYFGRLWTWVIEPLRRVAHGATPTATSGPFTASTANPVLVVGNRFDPATRYEGAQTVGCAPAALDAPHGQWVGSHVALPVPVRRPGDQHVPADVGDAGGGHGVQPGLHPLLGLDSGARGVRRRPGQHSEETSARRTATSGSCAGGCARRSGRRG